MNFDRRSDDLFGELICGEARSRDTKRGRRHDAQTMKRSSNQVGDDRHMRKIISAPSAAVLSVLSALRCFGYLSRATTYSGAHNKALLYSLSGNEQIAFRAISANCIACALAASSDPYRFRISRICAWVTPSNARSRKIVSIAFRSTG